MPRTVIAITDVTAQPPNWLFNPAAADFANSNMFLNDGRTILVVQNPTGGSINVSIIGINDQYGRADIILSPIAIGAGSIRFFGPFAPQAWNQLSGVNMGYVLVNPGASGLNVAAYKLAATGSPI